MAQSRDLMFDFLKKKITNFIDSITKKEEAKPAETAKEEKKPEPKIIVEEKKIEEKPKPEKKAEVTKEAVKEPPRHIPKSPPKPEIKMPKAEVAAVKPEEKTKPIPKIEEKKVETKKEEKIEPLKPKEKVELLERPKEKISEVKLGIFSQIKGLISGEVEIKREEVIDLLDTLELELLESDVAISVAEQIKLELDQKIVGAKVKKGEVNNFVKNAIKESLIDVMSNEKIFDVVGNIANYEKPVKIMFLGINGSGKTTSIAKIGKMLQDANYKVVFAAADTFRAAAIEQLSIHGERLGIKTIKREYGSDPTAVAYDAVNHAKAHGIDAVLIDTAGRQEKNINLVNELKKMDRVIAPHFKIYVGESLAGNAIVEQIVGFNKEIGVDGIILTKLDCDPKGGTMLSLSKVTNIPIIYVGMGQGYEDMEKFDARKIVERILS